MDRVNLEEGLRLLEAVEMAKQKRNERLQHEAAFLEYMCAESRLVTWLQHNAAGLLEAIQKLHKQAACCHGGWKVCGSCGWRPC